MPRLPLWLKIAYGVWLAVWIPSYWVWYGPANFLWLCDVANLLIGVAIWRESALLLSSQAVAVFLVQVAWAIDFGTALAAGFHPIGGTEYMFDPAKPLPIRLLSLFHLLVPPLLIWGLRRLGFDRRGWKLQTAIAWVVLPLSYVFGDAESNLNWLWTPFGIEQTWMPTAAFLFVAMAGYPLIVFLPTHAVLAPWFRPPRGRGAAQPSSSGR